MKGTLLTIVLALAMASLRAQSIIVTTPTNLEPPYEVSAGTEVTFTLTHFSAPTAFYSTATPPVFPEFGADPTWTVHENFTDNGDGTYSLTLTLNDPLYIWAGFFSDWIGWSFTNVTEVGIASGVIITAADGLLCDTGADEETLTVDGTFASYQWYFEGEPVEGATAASYAATAPGLYKVQVPLEDKQVFSNTLRIKTAAVEIEGTLQAATVHVVATHTLDTYQWVSGDDEQSLASIENADADNYTIDLTTDTVYYALTGTVAGCDVQSTPRPVSLAMFAIPVIEVETTENNFGKVCLGTEARLWVPDAYASYTWYQDGTEYFGWIPNEVSLTTEAGAFRVQVSPHHWPEITLESEEASVGYFTVLEPQLTGINNYAMHCAGETITATLSDEGYAYAWYVHTDYNYTEEDNVEVNGPVYSFTFAEATYLTVVASYLGCESSARYFLDSYESTSVSIQVSDYEQLYLCPGSNVDLSVSDASMYAAFQWYKKNGANYQAINGKTSATLTVTSPGFYRVEATVAACPSVTVTSFAQEVQDYSARPLTIYPEQYTLCEGESTTLSIDEGWTNIQWFRKDIVIGNTGYDEIYIPLEGAGTTRSQQVSDVFTAYVVKAKHESCAAGLKITSTPLQITPTLNPLVKAVPEQDVYQWHKAFYDSIPAYIFCEGAPAALQVDGEYETYAWHSLGYTGGGDYALGEPLAGSTQALLEFTASGAKWYTAKVTANGCTGFSRPVLIDTWVHNTPVVSSVSNAELCDENDSTVLALGFPGDWVKFEWYRDGELIPDSDNDTLYATVPGGYTLTGYPEKCPHIGYSSGLPVPVSYFPQATIEENDTLIYAMPEFGFYYYQWYKNGVAFEAEDLPWILMKDKMPSGVYTVEVSNPAGCSSLSDEYIWTITHTDEELAGGVGAFPNPATDAFTIIGIDPKQILQVTVLNAQGQRVSVSASHEVSVAALAPGVYVVEVDLRDARKHSIRVVRN